MTDVRLKSVRKEFGRFTAIENLDLSIESGSLVALLGQSGSGKTTTLRMIAGLEAPTSGEILFDGKDIADVAVRSRNVGMVFQRYALFPHMSVEKNIVFGLNVRGIGKRETRNRLDEILDAVKLEELRHRFPSQISGGQMQRVAIARTLITKPKVLMMDEPLANLDTNLRAEMRRFIRGLQRRFAITTIFVTHDQLEAMELADRIAVLIDGKLAQYDPPSKIYQEPQSAAVADFFGAKNRYQGIVADDGRIATEWGKIKVSRLNGHQAGDKAVFIMRRELIDISGGSDGQRQSDISDGSDGQRQSDISGGSDGRPQSAADGWPQSAADGRRQSANVIEGEIINRDYFGSQITYTVKAGSATLQVSEASRRFLEVGARVRCSIRPEHIWILPQL